MRLRNLVISRQRVRTVSSRASTPKATTGSGSSSRAVRSEHTTVSEAVLVDTHRSYEHCRCEEFGLTAGMLVSALRDLGAGCTDNRRGGHGRWVCSRLDRVRRRYGK